MEVRRALPVALILLILAGTVAATVAAARWERADADSRAQAAAERAAARVRLDLQTAEASVAGAAGLFDASGAVSAAQFAAFADRSLGHSQLTALAWLPRVRGPERADWERRSGHPIIEGSGPGAPRAPDRDEHFPIAYLAGAVPLTVPIGLDRSAEPPRRAALARAAAGDAVVATTTVALGGSGAPGLILAHPVYRTRQAPPTVAARRRALSGYVVGSYRLEALSAATRGATDDGVPIEIRDGDTLLTAPAARRDGASVDVAAAGRTWTVVTGRPVTSGLRPLAVIAGGGLLLMLAVLLAVTVARRDRFAEAAVRRATTDLERSRRSLRELADNSPDVVARYDRDLRCTFVNDAVTAATGLPPSEVVGRTSAEAGVPPELVERWESAMRRALAGEAGVEVDVDFPTPTGTRHFHSRLAPEPGDDGEVAHVLVVTRDVTGQVRAERALRASEDRYRSLVEALPAGIVVHDARGVIVSCNRAAEDILGLPAAQMSGRDPVDPRWRAVREDGTPYPGDEHAASRTLRTGEPIDGDLIGVHRPDGSLVWLSVSTRLRDDEAGRGVVSCFTDVTSRVEADREQAALRRVATLVAADPDMREVLDLVAREAAALTGSQAAGVVRFDPDGRSAVVAGVHGDVPGLAEPGARVDVALPTAAGRVAATGDVARLDGDGGGHPNALIPDAPAATAVAAPIRVDHVLWGALSAVTTDPEAPLPPGTEERLARLADLVALAIMSSEARAQMVTLASTDDLTGLPNRRSFTERLAEEIARADRHGTDLSLALLDIDHFKRVNDTHGHPVGDRVLMGVAAQLFGAVREGEMVARIGGEEFAWILPLTDGAGAAAAAERMRRHLGEVPFDEVGALTVSVGVCQLGEGMSGPELLRLADGALYRAKQEGRDRVVREIPPPRATAATPASRSAGS